MFKKVFLKYAIIAALAVLADSVILGVIISAFPQLAFVLAVAYGLIVAALLIVSFFAVNRKMKEHEKKREELFSDIVHDLRSPLTAISGYTENMLIGAIPPEKHEHYLEIVSDETKRLSRLVNSLLDASRSKTLDLSEFDICEMARVVLLSFEKRIEEKALCVDFRCARDRLLVFADRDAIYQVLYNICDNAVKFSRKRGKLVLSVEYNKDKAIISVYNEGRGVSREDLPRVFDRCFKGGEEPVGNGLGMFIAKNIIDAHSETIKAESEAGKWCRLAFTLALAEDNSNERK